MGPRLLRLELSRGCRENPQHVVQHPAAFLPFLCAPPGRFASSGPVVRCAVRLSDEFASMARQFRHFMASGLHWPGMSELSAGDLEPARVLRDRQPATSKSCAYSAVTTEGGSLVALVVQDTVGTWLQK